MDRVANARPVPYEFQREVVLDGEDFGGRVLISAEMGLGKTVMTLGMLIRENIQSWPAAVVCPSSMKFVWEAEAIRFGIRPSVMEGQKCSPKNARKGRTPRLTIINYDILHHRLPELLEMGISTVVYDESQMISSRVAKRTKAAIKLGRSARHVIALSGTPLVNRPAELWPTLHVIRPDLYPSFWQFAQRFCNPRKTPWGWDYSGAGNLDILHSTLLRQCFPYGIMVETDRGLLSIGEIVENELPVRVRSRNPEGGFSWRQVIAYSKRTSPGRMVRISFGGGELICTPDHPIWTKETGWCGASKITPGMHLLVVREKIYDQQAVGTLQLFMRGTAQGIYENSRKEDGGKTLGSATRTPGIQNLPALWKNYRKRRQAVFHMEQDEILLYGLWEEIQRKCEKVEDKINYQAMRMLPEDHPQGDDERLSLGKEKALLSRLCPSDQMAGHEDLTKVYENILSSQKALGGVGLAGIEFGSSYSGNAAGRSIQERWMVDSLGGRCSSYTETCDRDRWSFSQRETAAIKGCLEGETTQFTRVDSVEVFQRRGGQRDRRCGSLDYVYDIEVEKDHNFFANGCLVHNCMIRRLKSDVLKDLPDKIRQVVPVAITDWKEYELARDDFVNWLRARNPDKAESSLRAARLTQIGHLLRLCARLKLKAVVEWCNDFLEQSGEKLVVAAVHRKMIEALDRRIGGGKHVIIDGQVTGRLRKAAVDQFQRDPGTRLLIGNIKAAGVGITLTAASNVAFAELTWSPGAVVQMEDRCHRIGAKDTVWAHYLVAHGTIEERLALILQQKQAVIRATLDGAAVEDDLTVFDALIAELTKPGLLDQ